METLYFKDIDYADAGAPYEWDEFHVMRGSDGNLYVAEGSGCSCDWFWLDFSTYDVPTGWDGAKNKFTQAILVKSWQEAADNAKEWAEENSAREYDAMNLIERLTNSQPKGFDADSVLGKDEDNE